MAENESRRPANFFNTVTQRWEWRTRTKGAPAAYLEEAGLTVKAGFTTGSLTTTNSLKVGAGTEITKLVKYTGTLVGIAAVGTNTSATGTITGITAATGDFVMVTPKAVLGANILFGNAVVPSTNTVNVKVANTSIISAGSLPSAGVDVWVIKS